jgi:lipopolysaccharide/colanic/teichoic acid biosynthesis glycosyltransferase
MDYEDIDGLLVASFRGSGADTFYEVTKRCFDFLAASVLLAVLWPLLLVLAAFIRATSPGPALFKQERVGYHGKVFRIFKFRTMFQDAPANQYCPTDQADPRITPLGRFLRRTSLDELPQLLNVLRGEMSLVGPRPEMPFIANQYTALHRQRLTVRPGLTGMWQLSADRAYLIHENIEYDLYYIRHRNFFMDMAVLLHTVAFAARGI